MSRGPLVHVPAALQVLSPYRPKTEHPAIRLDANESPFPPDPSVLEGLLDAMPTSLHRYPDGGARSLKEALTTFLSDGAADPLHRNASLDPTRMVLGVGSDEIIAMLAAAFAGNGRASSVLFPAPTFVMYAKTAVAHGLQPVEVDLTSDFQLDPDAFRAALRTHSPALAFYATPNNPTGRILDSETLLSFIDATPDTLHIIDEAYAPFERPERTRLRWADGFENVAIMGTLSKVGFAGLRVGYLYAPRAIVDVLERIRQPYNLSAPVQCFAEQLLHQHASALRARAAQIVQERERIYERFVELGLDPIRSQGNFHLVKLDAERAKRLRAEHGIAVRVFSDQRLEGYARITVGTAHENDALLDALK